MPGTPPTRENVLGVSGDPATRVGPAGAYQRSLLWFLPWQLPLQVRLAPDPEEVTGLAGANTTFAVPFTCSAGPTMAAFDDGLPVPVAMPLWQSEQLRFAPMCLECSFVFVVGMLWQALQARVPPVQAGAAVVFPPVKLPWQ